MPDTKETREKKGRVKEQQRLESDIEAAVEAVDSATEPPLEAVDDEEDLDLDFEE